MTPVLTHVRLLVRDFPAGYWFYRDVLGLNATFGTEDDGYDGGVEIVIPGHGEPFRPW